MEGRSWSCLIVAVLSWRVSGIYNEMVICDISEDFGLLRGSPHRLLSPGVWSIS